MAKVHSIPTRQMDAYNDGYGAGYHLAKPESNKWDELQYLYLRAYMVGIEDRIEDEETIELGEFDLMTREEMESVYGHEERAADYRPSGTD